MTPEWRWMLADRLLLRPEILLGGLFDAAVSNGLIDRFMDEFRKAPRFECTNVHDWLVETGKNGNLRTDLPAPLPFPVTWFEWSAESMRVGCLMRGRGSLVAPPKDLPVGNYSHVMCAHLFATDSKTGNIFEPDADLWIFQNSDRIVIDMFTSSTREIPERLRAGLMDACLPALFCMVFLACKNVSTARVIPPARLAKKGKGDGVARCSYKVLRIDPRGLSNSHNSLSLTHKPSELPLHICRGHFKTYDGKGLFGKLKGTFWWADHARGDYQNGVVSKDYMVAV